MQRCRVAPSAVVALAVIVAAALAAVGCGSNGDDPVELTVSAAASVADAAEEVGAAFSDKTGSKVVFNVGASGQLAQQIEAGAPVDVFMSADKGYVEELVDADLVHPADMAPYARGTLVIWTSADRAVIEGVADLTSAGIARIATANPETAPYGEAARQALESAGILDEVQSKLVIGESVEQAQQYAESGNADVALVALSVVPVEGGRTTVVPQDLYHPIVQYLGVVSGSKHLDDARRFAEFVRSPAGATILERHGFSSPGP